MISGRQALATIEHTVAQARRDEAGLDAALAQASDQAARLRAERAEAFRELARIKLDAIQREGVVEELDAAERRALALLADRRQALEGLQERRRARTEAVARAEAERHARAEALERALGEIEELRNRVEAEARVSPEWAAQRGRIEQADRVAEQAERKAAQAETDREEKRRPYEADPLFMYLWRKRFGTGEDRSSFLVRWLDRKVARLVGYDKARANYALLNEIPERLRTHAERVRAEVQGERERLHAVERAALVAAGIEAIEARAGEARQAQAQAERDLGHARQDLAALDQEHDASVLQGDTPFREAIEVLATADSRQDLQTLYQEALRTPTPRDEALVQRIEATERAIGEAEQRLGQIRGQLRQQGERRAALERERDEFRRRGYDSPYGGFGNEQVIGNVLGGILGGLIQGAVLRDVLNQGYSRRPSPWDSDFGGGGWTPYDDSGPFGGGFGGGGGGFDTGGSFGGGGGDGFSTGGTV